MDREVKSGPPVSDCHVPDLPKEGAIIYGSSRVVSQELTAQMLADGIGALGKWGPAFVYIAADESVECSASDLRYS